MNLFDYLHFLEPVQENVSKVYSTTSGIITVVLVLWALNILVSLTQRTFSTGRAVGSFYRNYLHRYTSIFSNSLSKLIKKKEIQTQDNTAKNPMSALR